MLHYSNIETARQTGAPGTNAHRPAVAAAGTRVGIVVIGRNEGERLPLCLNSAMSHGLPVVYVDSGSTDDSPDRARGLGVDVVELSTARPFSAARGRNTGARRLLAEHPHIEYIQFIDGDCTLDPNWIDRALGFMVRSPKVAATSGRRREIDPGASRYNRLCDWEWNRGTGSIDFFGGDAMVRVSAFLSAGGFDERFLAGEEPDLSIRMRRDGWIIWRQEFDMTRHDVAIDSFGQWWRRSRRGGYAFALLAITHSRDSGTCGLGGMLRTLLWALVLPLLALVLSFWSPAALVLLLAYPANMLRMVARDDFTSAEAWERAALLSLIKFPEAIGVLQCFAGLERNRGATAFDYKSAPAAAPTHAHRRSRTAPAYPQAERRTARAAIG